jgi:hypothetical protein
MPGQFMRACGGQSDTETVFPVSLLLLLLLLLNIVLLAFHAYDIASLVRDAKSPVFMGSYGEGGWLRHEY